MITALVVLYCVIGYFFHQGILKEFAKDKSGDLDDVPDWFVKLCFVGCALFWPVVICWAIVEAFVKKEK